MSEKRRFVAAGEFHMQTEQELDEVGLADRVGSTSFVANLPGGERGRLLGEYPPARAALRIGHFAIRHRRLRVP